MSFVTHTRQAQVTASLATRPTETESNNEDIPTTGIPTQSTAPLSTTTESEEDIRLSNTNKAAPATQPPSSPAPGTTHNGPTPRRPERYRKDSLPDAISSVSPVPTKYPKAEPRPFNAPPPRIGSVDIADPRWAHRTLDTVACTTTPSSLDPSPASIAPRGDASSEAGAGVLVNILLAAAVLSLLAAGMLSVLAPRTRGSGFAVARARRSRGVRGVREEDGMDALTRWRVSPPHILTDTDYGDMSPGSRVPGISAPTSPGLGWTSALALPVRLHRRHVLMASAGLYAGGGLATPMELEDGAGGMCGDDGEEERGLSRTTSRTMEDVVGVVGDGVDRVVRGVVRWTEKGVEEERGFLLPS